MLSPVGAITILDASAIPKRAAHVLNLARPTRPISLVKFGSARKRRSAAYLQTACTLLRLASGSHASSVKVPWGNHSLYRSFPMVARPTTLRPGIVIRRGTFLAYRAMLQLYFS